MSSSVETLDAEATLAPSGADGNVAMVEIASSKIVTPIERCAVNAATHWLFPPTKGKRSGPTTVTVPISFALPAS